MIAPDLRGHGRSEKVLDGHTVPVQTADLHELIGDLDLGDDLVLVHAKRQPERMAASLSPPCDCEHPRAIGGRAP